MRYLALLMLYLCPAQVLAQATDIQPRVTIEVPPDPTIVGQPAIVRLKVLVPTYMPNPPVFPSLEQENLLVRLPERASGPVSESIEGQTWSGVQRSYRLYPLAPGTYEFAAAEVQVTYADPETNDPVQVSVPLPAARLTAQVPDAARGLDPLIIAKDFALRQKIEGDTNLQTGDALTRTLTATISGTTAIMIPALLPPFQDPLLRAYPGEPRLSETENRGVLSGQRTDRVTYVAQDGGQARLPGLEVDWFNLESGAVETARVGPVDLILAPPPWQPPDRETILRISAVFTILSVGFWLLARRLRPILEERWRAARHRRLSSAGYAFAELRRAVRQKDIAKAYQDLEAWKRRLPDPVDTSEFEASLARIGAVRYGGRPQPENWSDVQACLKRIARPRRHVSSGLPKLNP
ncbi:Oxygen tolerance [Ruegeria intermedia]|uniref:Oxygen tolerance n=1 Tax=Ruegeria intermedia TaxID=996115 RepID=A0A1M4T942_9RHOB|nr:BatD family protein [Ruegeria intermedia]SHE40930.1 Oxygen tolerance [Ruegeria intermedia]